MTTIDRRKFVAMTACAALASIVPTATGPVPVPSSLSPIMAARIRTMHDAMAALEAVTGGVPSDDVVCYARHCVEQAFATPSACVEDEDGVMLALDAYEKIHPSAFAMQTARDLFTPRRHQTYPLDRLRHWLLTDPDEDFSKTGMPGFLQKMRARQRALHELG